MTGKERIRRILNRQEVDRNGFWLGRPHRDALKIYKEYFNVRSRNQLLLKLKSDLVWISGESVMLRPLFLPRGFKIKSSLSEGGLLSGAETVEDVEKIYWTKSENFAFPLMRHKLNFAIKNNLAVFSGMGSYFFHNLTDFFGMEECFIKMYTHPDVVERAAQKIVDIYYNANEALYRKYAEYIDSVFFFNDLGTQLDTLISPDLFRQFFLPGAKKLIDQAKRYKLKVTLHSCGSVERFIPDLIEAGVDGLHPIQARARNMEAESLAQKYGDKLIFMGGLDTQEILPLGTPQEVAAETRRLINVFGKHFILSPSHEALLANVCGANVQAMADEATKIF
ncbi:MAG: uroporphyrinogen decarboxylase family protein [Christensenellales bacterium]|jgi:uroporphyrinogen decarboxylase